MQVLPFAPEFEDQVVDLVVGIQREEFGLDIDAERQPDLRDVPGTYQVGAGNFWVALVAERVVGTASLLDIGGRQAALRKMFVHEEHRGPGGGVARALLNALLDWARRHGTREIFLGTTPVFLAAHRFYEKNGFTEIARSGLPAAFPVMEVDTKFYHLRLG